MFTIQKKERRSDTGKWHQKGGSYRPVDRIGFSWNSSEASIRPQRIEIEIEVFIHAGTARKSDRGLRAASP